jgi:dihydroxyacetone kinase phosphoprotein-dependent L subunit
MFLNDPADAVDEMLDGFVYANADRVERVAPRVLAARRRRAGVGIVTGGGSGHKPAFIGYLGPGMLDAVAVGDVFASPPAHTALEAIRAADNGHGVLCLLGNYSGDIMNFRMAAEMAAAEGIDVRLAIATDDAAAASPEHAETRRGVSGQFLIWKICGAHADSGANLDELTELATAVNRSTRTVGAAVTGATVPGTAAPTFTLADGEMEFGVGHHGEPGRSRDPLPPVDEVVARMVRLLLDDLGELAEPGHPDGGSAAVLVNGLGATPQLELYVAFRKVAAVLEQEGLHVRSALVGEFFTALGMAGFSVTISLLDNRRARLLNAPADTVAYRSLPSGVQPSAWGAAPRKARSVAKAAPPAAAAGTRHADAADRAARQALLDICAAVIGARDELCRLDANLGDGDHGVSMAKTFGAVADRLRESGDADLPTLLHVTGQTALTQVGGAMGPLFGSAFLAAADALREEEAAGGGRDGAAAARALDAAVAAVQARGGAKPGDKTMVDALVPAAEAARAAAIGAHITADRAVASETAPRAAAGVPDVLQAAAEGAERGVAATAGMVARMGRAARLGDRTLGHPDAGATSVALILRTAADAVRNTREDRS